jgi:hypothetical protein
MNDENADLLADSHNIINICKKSLFQIVIMHIFIDVRQIEIHTADPLPLRPSPFEVERAMHNANLSKYKSTGSVQIVAELIQAGDEILLRSIKSLVVFERRKKCMISGRNL